MSWMLKKENLSPDIILVFNWMSVNITFKINILCSHNQVLCSTPDLSVQRCIEIHTVESFVDLIEH
jgi:hypothetical protein